MSSSSDRSAMRGVAVSGRVRLVDHLRRDAVVNFAHGLFYNARPYVRSPDENFPRSASWGGISSGLVSPDGILLRCAAAAHLSRPECFNCCDLGLTLSRGLVV